MLGWRLPEGAGEPEQLTLELGRPAPEPDAPAELDVDDGLSWDEWFRSLPLTP